MNPNIELKKYKKDFEYSYSFGAFPTIELLKSKPDKVLKILVKEKFLQTEGYLQIKTLAEESDVKIEINDKSVNRIADTENTYVVGIFQKYSSELSKNSNHLVLYNPDDMGNIGTIIRTMLGFRIKNITLIRPAADIFHPKVIRASMGAVFKINFSYFDTFEDYSSNFPENIIYPFLLNGKKSLDEVKFQQPFSLVFGNEGSGLPKNFDEVENSITIPHSKEIDSLNLSISVGISLYAASLTI